MLLQRARLRCCCGRLRSQPPRIKVPGIRLLEAIRERRGSAPAQLAFRAGGVTQPPSGTRQRDLVGIEKEMPSAHELHQLARPAGNPYRCARKLNLEGYGASQFRDAPVDVVPGDHIAGGDKIGASRSRRMVSREQDGMNQIADVDDRQGLVARSGVERDPTPSFLERLQKVHIARTVYCTRTQNRYGKLTGIARDRLFRLELALSVRLDGMRRVGLLHRAIGGCGGAPPPPPPTKHQTGGPSSPRPQRGEESCPPEDNPPS